SVSFEAKRGEKIAFIGSNGTGKSTMLKVLQNMIPHNKGIIDWAENVKISYFDQEGANLNPENTVINELHNRNRTMLDKEIRGALGRVRLTGENVFKKVGVISGGERAKLCFAIMIEERGNVLILDEPTNHLDLVSKEELEEALCKFDQTIFFVSHDRYLLNRLATRIIEIEDGGIVDYPYGFAEYMNAQREKMKAEEQEIKIRKQKTAEEKNTKVYRTKEQRSADAARKQRIKAIEKEIEELESLQATLEEEITLPEITRDYQLLNEKCMQIEETKNKISELSDEWIELSE
ncbi:MAG: ABC-F family ATP-binding cassette domain-containing protein, partial [Oscillospiraceae bacterium]|nr:ABC-F family ATP-binding cassette domain-containing protein [Oscillospiraceae bacterium]